MELRRDDVAGTDEGAAMGEVIYDLAPGAGMAFHSCGFSKAGLADAIASLVEDAGCTVLVDNMLWLSEPVFQDGIVASAAQSAVASGVAYFTAAGNQSNHGYRQTFSDLSPLSERADPPTGVDLHNWGFGHGGLRDGFLRVVVPPDDPATPETDEGIITVVLQWNQPFESEILRLDPDAGPCGAQCDLDLYLTAAPDAAGLAAPLALSTSAQGDWGAPMGDAFESVTFANPSPSTSTVVYIAVDHYQGNTYHIPQSNAIPLELMLVLFSDAPDLDIEGIADATSVHGGTTIYGHAQTEGVVSVAAVPWFDTSAFDPTQAPSPHVPPEADVSTMDPQLFTARGGALEVYFDNAGSLYRSADGQPRPRVSYKPDLTAVDATNTTFFGRDLDFVTTDDEPDGYPNFVGTSAAAAHAAGVAALLRDYNSALSPGQIEAVLKETAVDIVGYRASPGVDDVTGAGLIDAAAALRGIAPILNMSLNGKPLILDRASADPAPVQTSPGNVEIAVDPGIAFTHLTVFLGEEGFATICGQTMCAVQLPVGAYPTGLYELGVLVHLANGATTSQRVPVAVTSDIAPPQHVAQELWMPAPSPPPGDVQAMVLDGAGRLWLIGGSAPAYTWNERQEVAGGTIRHVYELAADAPGNALYGLVDGEWHMYSGMDLGDPDLLLTSLAAQGATLWIGSNKGLLETQVSPAKSRPTLAIAAIHDKGSGLAGSWVSVLHADGDSLWVGSRGSAYFKHSAHATTRYWLDGGGVSFRNYPGWTTWSADQPAGAGIVGSDVLALAPYAAVPPGMWIATEAGLSHFDGSSWFYLGEIPGLSGSTVLSMALDASGALWLGTTAGLARLENGAWHVFTTANSGLPGNRVASLLVDPAGILWVATDAGLASYDPDGAAWRTHGAGAAGPAHTLVLAADGTIWTAASDGVQCAVGQFLPDLAVALLAPPADSRYAADTDGLARVTLEWTPRPGALAYEVFLNGASLGQTTSASRQMVLAAGTYAWSVRGLYPYGTAGPQASARVFGVVEVVDHAEHEFLLLFEAAAPQKSLFSKSTGKR